MLKANKRSEKPTLYWQEFEGFLTVYYEAKFIIRVTFENKVEWANSPEFPLFGTKSSTQIWPFRD